MAFTYSKGADAAASVVKEIERDGGKAIAIQADAADADAVKAAVEKAAATFGELDILVNNAGTAIPKPFEETTLEEMDRVIDINIRGVFVATQAALKHMKSGGRIIMIGSAVGGSIINISSTLGQKTAPGASIYAATKHAVEGLTKTAALEAASANVRVNAVAPGPIDTGMLDRFTGSAEKKAGLIAGVPLKRMGRPEEVAQMILFLASDKAPFITGQIFGIDGGKMA